MITYGDFKLAVADIYGSLPSSIDILTKLVLNKIARKIMPTRSKVATLSLGGNTSFDMKILFPGFYKLKVDLSSDGNTPLGPYYYRDTTPVYLNYAPPVEFPAHTEGGYFTFDGTLFKISNVAGNTPPATMYVPYYSYFMVLDADGVTEKDKPTDDEDILLLDGIYDDVAVEGVGLYIKQKEMDDNEFQKSLTSWQQGMSDLVYTK